MISEVTANIQDNNTGASGDVGTGRHAKIGICGSGVKAVVQIRSTMDADAIKAKVGSSPMADACMDSVENGSSLIYCIPVEATTKAAIGAVTKDVKGTGTIEVSGEPHNGYNVVILIDADGGFNEGTYTVSLNGGRSFQETRTIPLAGTEEIEGTGITLTFKEGASKFKAGDKFSFKVTPPAMSNGDVLKAVDALRNFSENIEFVHIVGETSPELWASLELKGQLLERDSKKPLLFLVEQRMPEDGEELEEYVEDIKNDAKDIGRHVVAVQTCGKYMRMDGSVQKINIAGIIAGMISRAAESTSIAYVREFPISSRKLTELYPAGIEEYMETLDEGRYIALRKHTGKDDWYVISANTTAKASSDFSFIENCRVMYRAVREVCKIATELQNMDYDGENREVELKAVQEELQVPVDDMKNEKVISDGSVTILMDEIDDRTGLMPVKVELVRRGYIRSISLTFTAVNPTAGE